MEVKLLSHTPNTQQLVATAARLCYSADDIDDILKKMEDEKGKKLINKLIKLGHQSPFEHISFTFGISGVSRSLTHQLVRHRIASYSQKSQRYVAESKFDYITPPSIQKNEEAAKKYGQLMEKIANCYEELSEIAPKEDARYVLPNSCETKIVATFNARSLFNFFNHRMCTRAQWEIRLLSEKIYEIVNEIAPEIFSHFGASCDSLGYCPEGSMCCGKAPTLEEKRRQK
ncbi:FAD-dependent thymidylate synthase [Proteinivorax hydrogeniformans]|uniref:Flavin-dependent thymidylate synthase n=1 Tax=Proteinivorax hydrogeniformans TaxID=1826727 RepID=A0AAU8HTI2_9FIRM